MCTWLLRMNVNNWVRRAELHVDADSIEQATKRLQDMQAASVGPAPRDPDSASTGLVRAPGPEIHPVDALALVHPQAFGLMAAAASQLRNIRALLTGCEAWFT